MPTVQIVGLPPHLQIADEAQECATGELPWKLSNVEGIGIDPKVVTVQYLTDGVRRPKLRLTAHVFDLFVRDERTPEVRKAAALVIRSVLLHLCEILEAEVETITVCLGAFAADEHGFASWPESK